MKKVLSVLLVIFMLVTTTPIIMTSAAAVMESGTTGDCTWMLDGTVLTISGNGAMGDYNNYSILAPWGTDITEVIIKKGVTSIGSFAFYFCDELKNITIPDSIKSIGRDAFMSCESLLGIVIPEGVISIGEGAFYNCSNIKDIVIPNSVTSIGEDAFSICRFTSITIPSSVTYIGAGAFSYGSLLTSIEVDKNNSTYYSVNNCIIKKSTNALVAGCNSSIIPDAVTSIGEAAFSGCNFLNITIPDSVTGIGKWAFSGCDLTSLTIPKNVISIDYGAFYLCDNLTDVYYSGTRIDEEKMNIVGGNEDLTVAKWHYAPCENDAHIYSYACSTLCQNCDFIRTTDTLHIYDDDCDEACNVCSESRKPKHIFIKNGENTATCKICSLSKTYDFIITTDEEITLSYEAPKEFEFLIENTSVAEIGNVSSSVVSLGSYYKQMSKAKVLSVYPGETVVKIIATNGTVLTTSSLLVVEGEHQFDNACDTTCNFCSETRMITHIYDNGCDTECNICEYIRTVPTHNYDVDHICTECGVFEFVLGDIDEVVGVTAADALMTLQAATGKINLDETATTAADVDGQAGITANDALLILQYATQKITAFPIAG